MPLTPAQISWLKEYEKLPDVELSLLSEFSGSGLDSPNRAAIARYELNRRSSAIRDGREERTLAMAKEALSNSRLANIIAICAIIFTLIAAVMGVDWSK